MHWTLPPPEVDPVEALAEHARTSLPRVYSQGAETEIDVDAEVLAFVLRIGEHYHRLTSLLGSHGIWLEQHARDRGVYRQGGESESSLADRIRAPEATVTAPAILAAAQQALAAEGIPGDPALTELPLDGAYCLDTPDDPDDAEGFAFAAEPGTDAWGYRASTRNSFVLILPAGAEPLIPSIRDLLRLKKAAGIPAFVEVAPDANP